MSSNCWCLNPRKLTATDNSFSRTSDMCEAKCWSFVMLVFLASSSSSSSFSSPASLSSSAQASDEDWYCDKSNNGPGPLNLTGAPSLTFPVATDGQQVYLFHCVRFFKHFHWFKLRGNHSHNEHHHCNDTYNDYSDPTRWQPFPWDEGGDGGRVGYLPGRGDNQTVVIREVKRAEDSGVYAFVASNDSHSVSGRVCLQVDCRATDPSFSTSVRHVQAVDLGSQKTLACAVNPSPCHGKFYESKVHWVWQSFNSGLQSILTNHSFPFVSVVCDNGGYFGGKCDVRIRHVEDKLFHGEFACLIDSSENANQTVRLVPIGSDVKSWLSFELGIAGGAVVLVTSIAVTWWRCRRWAGFRFRSQPGRGSFESDAVILHGEDHEALVKHFLLPGVRSLGYNVLEEVTSPERLELLDQLEAVENSHSVLLTFSAREIAEDKHIQFLTRVVFSRKNHATVLFLRWPHHHHDDDDDDDDDDGNVLRVICDTKEHTQCRVECNQQSTEDTQLLIEHTQLTIEHTQLPTEDTQLPIGDTQLPIEHTQRPIEHTQHPIEDTQLTIEDTHPSVNEEETAQNETDTNNPSHHHHHHQQQQQQNPGQAASSSCPQRTATSQQQHKQKQKQKNPWKNEAIRSFKILEIPQSLLHHHHHAGSPQDRSIEEAQDDEEQFWSNLKKHLPKPTKTTTAAAAAANFSKTKPQSSTTSFWDRRNTNVGRLSRFTEESPLVDSEWSEEEDGEEEEVEGGKRSKVKGFGTFATPHQGNVVV
ncbi:uncharacterized protein LOC143275389 [Babylonia areolata]|uniref:uncharacterized protein LOC143275389 n=1 Tax=Babylonia areolata TaxID=304850 RepID=UPI003FD694D9